MEFDLASALESARRGDPFPQFVDTWSAWVREGERLADSLPVMASERTRIATEVRSPAAFCALLTVMGPRNLDMVLLNPDWTNWERAKALEVASPCWHIRDAGSIGFHANRFEDGKPMAQSVADGARFMIPTGGSSGAIRFAIHRWETLLEATHGLQRLFDWERISSVCMLPLYHISGFMQVIRSVVTGGCVAFGATKEFETLHLQLQTSVKEKLFLSIVATQLERLLRDESAVEAMRSYRAIFVGGGPTPSTLLRRARKLGLPLAPTYGMTETAAQVATLLPRDFLAGGSGQGRALPHARIRIVDNEGRRLQASKKGRISIESSSLFHGYSGEEELHLERFLAGDLGSLDNEGRLTVLGRVDRVIVSGGEKIDLVEVEAALDADGLVGDRFAFGLRDAKWGERLVVAYVPKAREIGEDSIVEALEDRLARYKLPKTWLRLDSLPTTEAGKPRLGVLRKRAQSRI